MTIGKLKQLIENIPDETRIVISGSDHSYREGRASLIDAAESKGYLGEWYGDPDHYDDPINVIQVVLVD